jgi:sec-independent protein translocase protein TatA
MFEGLSPVHLIVILAIALLVLGPGKLPETGAALGKALRGFRHAMSDDEATPTSPSEPAPPAPPPGPPPAP